MRQLADTGRLPHSIDTDDERNMWARAGEGLGSRLLSRKGSQQGLAYHGLELFFADVLVLSYALLQGFNHGHSGINAHVGGHKGLFELVKRLVIYRRAPNDRSAQFA